MLRSTTIAAPALFALALALALVWPSAARAQPSFELLLADSYDEWPMNSVEGLSFASWAGDISGDGASLAYTARGYWWDIGENYCIWVSYEDCPFAAEVLGYRRSAGVSSRLNPVPCEVADPYFGACGDFWLWFETWANGVSGDGQLLVGQSIMNGRYISGSASIYYESIVRWPSSTPEATLSSQWVYFTYTDVSDDGSIITGNWINTNGNSGHEAFVEIQGAQVERYFIPDLPGVGHGYAWRVSRAAGVVVGADTSSSGMEAFRWEGGVTIGLGDLPGGGFHSEARGVSDDGKVIVGFGESAAGTEAFYWQGGVMWPLGFLSGAGDSKAFAVSAAGHVVGGESGGEAFVWDTQNGMRRLQDILEVDLGLDLQGVTPTRVVAMSSDALHITGDGTNAEGNPQAWYAELPASVFPSPPPPGPVSPVPGPLAPTAALIAFSLLVTGRRAALRGSCSLG